MNEYQKLRLKDSLAYLRLEHTKRHNRLSAREAGSGNRSMLKLALCMVHMPKYLEFVVKWAKSVQLEHSQINWIHIHESMQIPPPLNWKCWIKCPFSLMTTLRARRARWDLGLVQS